MQLIFARSFATTTSRDIYFLVNSRGLVFKSLVRSGLLTLRAQDRDRDRLIGLPRLPKTGLFAVFNSQNPKDWTAGLVFSGLGPVQSRSFSSLETGPSNTSGHLLMLRK